MSEIEITNTKENSDMNNENTIFCLGEGFVRLVDVMGDDSSVTEAARVSYGKGTKNIRRDKGLINYLMKHKHFSPFEMVEFKFHCKMPIFVARQWIRHRTASVNEISGRYSIMEETSWVPQKTDLREQSKINRQGSIEVYVSEPQNSQILEQYKNDQKLIFEHYNQYLEKGVAREIARTNLPLSTFTEWYWKIDLHNLLHFLELRMEAHAQKEIRVYAEAIAKFVKEKCPLCFEAFQEYRYNATTFSNSESNLIRKALEENNLIERIIEKRLVELKENNSSDALINVEIAELRAKLTGNNLE